MTDRATLRVIDRDGEPRELGMRPAELWALLQELDPDRHRHVELELVALRVRVWPRKREGETGSLVCLRAQDAARTAWLGQSHEGPSFELEGRILPARLEVPITWASNALGFFVQGVRWPRYLPWHDDERWLPEGPWRGDRFSFASMITSADEHERERWVDGLYEELERNVCGGSEPRRAFAEVIGELRRVGHDLWSWDNDGDGEIWGHDYMRAAPGQGLVLEVRYEPEVAVGVRFGGLARGVASEVDE
jgi:hypothetical protein